MVMVSKTGGANSVVKKIGSLFHGNPGKNSLSKVKKTTEHHSLTAIMLIMNVFLCMQGIIACGPFL